MIKVTDADLCHIDAIEAMEKQCFSAPWTREMLIKQLPDDMHIFLAAEDDDGEAVGYIGLMYVLDEGYISNVAVSPERRRQGIGDMLIEELIIPIPVNNIPKPSIIFPISLRTSRCIP